jgi:glucose-1-phosphate cytidylyltransferase
VKAVLLAGGLGTRLREETAVRPKPMVEIGGQPILWHIMKLFSFYGINEFVICCGYRGWVIKEYFANYFLRMSDVTFDLRSNKPNVHWGYAEPWVVTLVDTGEETMTGGRLKRVREYLDDETFCFTYGDGIGNIDIGELVAFHREQNVLATLTATQPPGRFGALVLADGETKVGNFREKPEGDGAWINGGFFVLEPEAIDCIADDSTVWEQEPLRNFAREGQLAAYRHTGFWHPMDTLNDQHLLDELWRNGEAPWKIWGDRDSEIPGIASP